VFAWERGKVTSAMEGQPKHVSKAAPCPHAALCGLVHLCPAGQEHFCDLDRDAVHGALMVRAQDGDGQSYRLLLREVAPQLRRFVGRKASYLTAEDREDVVQDVLMSLHLARASFEPGRPFRPWLMAIAGYRLADHLRKRTRRRPELDGIVMDEETFCPAPTKCHAQGVVGLLDMRRALNSLSTIQKQAIQMLRVEQMSLKEASTLSGRSVAALKVAVHRATLALRRELDDGSGNGNR